MIITGEPHLVEKAIEIEQKGDTHSRALARAMRGVMMPLAQHMEGEVKTRWTKSADEMAASIETTAHVLGCFAASMAMTASDGMGRAARLNMLNIIVGGVMESAQKAEKNYTNEVEGEKE